MAKKKAPEEDATPQSEYTVLARRYRPQQFKDLCGQEPVAQALTNALKSNRVAHAYLFTGARGVGKTSAARILAKALNCVHGPTVTPCDQCEMCQAIASGEDVDVLEIDGASNNGVDSIRELRQNVQYRPQRGRYKIYIIDEVHMLSTGAFNALLKTLEEPPAHVKFIFATTETRKIPVTILSRCQRFDFAGINMQQLRARLHEIVKAEGMEADDEAIELVARRAAGSMRDAQSLLDQLLSFGGERLTVESVHRLLGTANEDRVVALASAVLAKDARQALDLLGEVVDRGQQLGELLDQLTEYWRDLMVVQAAGIEGQSLSVTGTFRAALKAHAESLSPDTILAGLDVLVSAKNRMEHTTHGRVVFEMALVRLARLDNLVGLSQLVQWVQEGQASPVRPASSGKTGVADSEKKKPVVSDRVPLAEPLSEAAGPIPFTPETLDLVWQQLLTQAGYVLNGELRRSERRAISAPNALELGFPARYNLRGDQLLDPSRKAQAEELLAKITGQPVQIHVVILTEAAIPGNPAELPVQKTRRARDEILKIPHIGKAVELLGAQIVVMEDGFGTPARSAVPATSASDEEDSLDV